MIGSQNRKAWVARVVWWLLPVGPALFTLRWSQACTPNQPKADHWPLEGGPLLAWHAGTLGWGDFWQQVNDSRMPLPRLFYLAIALATKWNVTVEAGVGVGMALLAAWGLQILIERTRPGPGAWRWVFAVVGSLLLLTPLQVMNWTFGVIIAYFCVVLGALGVSLVFTTRWRLATKTALGILCSVLATGSFLNGFLVWGLVVFSLLGEWRRENRGRVMAGMGATLVALAGTAAWYFHGYEWHTGGSLWLKLVTRPREMAIFYLSLLGAPLPHGWSWIGYDARGPWHELIGPITGGVALVWAALLVVAHGRELWKQRSHHPAWAWVGLCGWTLLVAFVISLGRLDISVSDAYQSRYLAFTTWFYLALLALTGLLPTVWARRVLAVVLPVIGLAWVNGCALGLRGMKKDRERTVMLRAAVTLDRVAPEPRLLWHLTPDWWLRRPLAWKLEELGYRRPPMIRSPRVAEADVRASSRVVGRIEDGALSPTPELSGFAIDLHRHRPVDAICLSVQPQGGEEVWLGVAQDRVLRRKTASRFRLKEDDSSIGWTYTPQDGSPVNLQHRPLPVGPCTFRAYALDTETNVFYRLRDEISLILPEGIDQKSPAVPGGAGDF